MGVHSCFLVVVLLQICTKMIRFGGSYVNVVMVHEKGMLMSVVCCSYHTCEKQILYYFDLLFTPCDL